MKYLITILAVGSLGVFAACSGEAQSTAADNTTDATTEQVSEEVAVPEVSKEEKLAEEYIGGAPKAFAGACRGMEVIGRPAAERIATKSLGSQIARFNPDVSISGTIEEMLDRC